MRSLYLHRSRTIEGLTVSFSLHQSPLILYNQNDEDDQQGINRLGLSVTINSPRPKQIGGITVLRQVLLKRRIPKSKKWGDWEQLQHESIHVVGDMTVDGKQKLECSIPLPRRLPETRETFYDNVIHTLTVVVHDVAPAYTGPSRSGLTKRARSHSAPLNHLNNKIAFSENAFPGSLLQHENVGEGREIIALERRMLDVVHCPSPPGDMPTLDWGQMLRLADSGKVTVRAHADLLVLGGALDLTFDFTGLTPETTIHAVSTKLIQETATPLKTALSEAATPPGSPNPASNNTTAQQRRPERSRRPVLSRLSSLWASAKEKPPLPKSSIMDEYILHTEGEDHIVAADEFQVREGYSLWRGSAGRFMQAENQQPASGNSPIDEDDVNKQTDVDTSWTTTTMHLHRRARIPSFLQSATPTSSTLTPVLAKVTHRLEVDVIYSILGQDQLGKPLPSGISEQEGSLRLVRGIAELCLGSCSITAGTIQPPEYVGSLAPTSSVVSRQRPNGHSRRLSMRSVMSQRPSSTPPSALIPHSRAFLASNGIVIGGKSVPYDEDELRSKQQHHFERNGHACACCQPHAELEPVISLQSVFE